MAQERHRGLPHPRDVLTPRVGRVTTLCALVLSACVPDAGRPDLRARSYLAIVAAEDARPDGGPELELLRAATRIGNPFLRGAAVRALGRLERPELLADIDPLLDDVEPSVRALAAGAVAQALQGTSGDPGLQRLMARIEVEEDAAVRGALGHALGRLDVAPSSEAAVERALVGLTRAGDENAPAETLIGALAGLEDFARRTGEDRPLGASADARLRDLFFRSGVSAPSDRSRVRSLALATLHEGGRSTIDLVQASLRDPDEDVRRMALSTLSEVVPDLRSDAIRRSLVDPSTIVRVQAIELVADDPRDATGCTRLMAAGRDQETAPRLVALDALAEPCPDRAAQSRYLRSIADALDTAGVQGWHEPAHALVALARLDPGAARQRLASFAEHGNPFVRAYAARAAGTLQDRATLRRLAQDDRPSVRAAAIRELFDLDGHRIDLLLRDQLGSDDPELLLTVARLLRGSPGGADVAEAARRAFARVSRSERETLRDPRRALLALIGELGDADMAPGLQPYLGDYDAVVAQDVSRILTGWTGEPFETYARPLPRAALPTVDDLHLMDTAIVALHMRRGGTIQIRLLPYAATTNAFRFLRLAREGYFDGLTFHRWVADFVIQGGSPAASEYSGDAAYTRDELATVSHLRGTVGVSTRGHDTGDGQIFINLVDNLRLDHQYTVFGVVTAGMDAVDAVMEGDVIERAEVRPAG